MPDTDTTPRYTMPNGVPVPDDVNLWNWDQLVEHIVDQRAELDRLRNEVSTLSARLALRPPVSVRTRTGLGDALMRILPSDLTDDENFDVDVDHDSDSILIRLHHITIDANGNLIAPRRRVSVSLSLTGTYHWEGEVDAATDDDDIADLAWDAFGSEYRDLWTLDLNYDVEEIADA